MITLPSDYPQNLDWTSQTNKVPMNGTNMEHMDTLFVTLCSIPTGRDRPHNLMTDEDLLAPSASNKGGVMWCSTSSTISWSTAAPSAPKYLYWTGSSIMWADLPIYQGEYN